MDFDARPFFTGSGILFALVMCLLFILCCRRRDHQQGGSLENAPQQQQPRGRRQKNARRKWRRRRDNHHDRAVIVEHEVPCPESAVPGQTAYQPTQPPVHNPQYIINLNPPSEMPFQTGHYPPPPPFQAQQQPPWQQVGQNVHFPAPPHVGGIFPQEAHPPFGGGPYVQHQQQQPGGFAQLYAQAQPDMNVFPQPPPPYETQPFLHLPTKDK